MANIFREFFSEKDAQGQLTGSSKRLIAIMTAVILIWGYTHAMNKATTGNERLYISIVYLSYVLIILGVATFPQIASIFRGTVSTKDDEPKTPTS